MRKAIFAGSFDPFTIGHLDIVKKSSELFDEVHVVIAVNSKKTRSFVANEMADAIRKVLHDTGINNCYVVTYNGLVAQYCKEHGIKYFVRGLRNSMDYNYEENIAEGNALINPELEYVYLRADHVAISSTLIKELMSYGQDVSKYVPKEVLNIIL